MKNKELLPCPFCGGEAFAVTGIVDEGIRQIMCRKCYAKTTVYRTRKDAIAAWNTRTERATAIKDFAEKLKAIGIQEGAYDYVSVFEIDNLAKEMVGAE